jgi:hypothetical protein
MLFLVTALIPITSFSAITSNCIVQDTTVLITSNQLKTANLIFIEHDKLYKENTLLLKQIADYQEVIEILQKTDSTRLEQLDTYRDLSTAYKSQIKSLNKTINKKDRTVKAWKIGGLTVSVGLFLLWLLK